VAVERTVHAISAVAVAMKNQGARPQALVNLVSPATMSSKTQRYDIYGVGTAALPDSLVIRWMAFVRDFELFADFSLPITQITNRNPAFSLKWMAKFAATCSARAGPPQKIKTGCSSAGREVLAQTAV